MHYSIRPPADAAHAAILSQVLSTLRSDKKMQADLSKLERACCAPQGLIVPAGAPSPAIMSTIKI
jgi:hypothetical protein